MRKPVSYHIIGKLPRALEQQIILNAANVFAAAEGTDAACTGFSMICEVGLSYCVQEGRPHVKRGASELPYMRRSIRQT